MSLYCALGFEFLVRMYWQKMTYNLGPKDAVPKKGIQIDIINRKEYKHPDQLLTITANHNSVITHRHISKMQSSIKTVGVVGTGVIGASWTALFLSRGLRVFVSDPAPGAKDRLFAYLQDSWPMLKELGLHNDASISNCTFVGESLGDHCSEVDFIQEV